MSPTVGRGGVSLSEVERALKVAMGSASVQANFGLHFYES